MFENDERMTKDFELNVVSKTPLFYFNKNKNLKNIMGMYSRKRS
jgi:hypothetical protein